MKGFESLSFLDEFEIEQVVGQAGQVPCIYSPVHVFFFSNFLWDGVGPLPPVICTSQPKTLSRLRWSCVLSSGTSGEFEEQRGYRKTPGRIVTWRPILSNQMSPQKKERVGNLGNGSDSDLKYSNDLVDFSKARRLEIL